MTKRSSFDPEFAQAGVRAFEVDLERCFGARIRMSEDFAAGIWGALANVIWRRSDGLGAAYTWRQAGDLIADVRGHGDYMDWYMSSDVGVVTRDIADPLHAMGWSPWCGDDIPARID